MESLESIGKESERVRNWLQDILEPVVYIDSPTAAEAAEIQARILAKLTLDEHKIEHRARVHEWFRNRTSLFSSSQDFPLNKEPVVPMPELVAAHLGRNTPLSFLEALKERWINA